MANEFALIMTAIGAAAGSVTNERADRGGWKIGKRIVRQRRVAGDGAAGYRALAKFGAELMGPIRSALDDIRGNFANDTSQGANAYAEQMMIDHPELDPKTVQADAMVAVAAFHHRLYPSQ